MFMYTHTFTFALILGSIYMVEQVSFNTSRSTCDGDMGEVISKFAVLIRFNASPGQNGRLFADDIFRCIFLIKNV